MIEVNITYPETRFYINEPDYYKYVTFPKEYQIEIIEIIEGLSRRIILKGIDGSEEIKTISKEGIQENLSKILSMKNEDDFVNTIFDISGIKFKFAIYELDLM
mgnify:FL=1